MKLQLHVIIGEKGLGEGGFGKVCQGTMKTEKDDTWKVACKEMLYNGYDHYFEREVGIWKELNHLFLVKLFGLTEVKSKR